VRAISGRLVQVTVEQFVSCITGLEALPPAADADIDVAQPAQSDRQPASFVTQCTVFAERGLIQSMRAWHVKLLDAGLAIFGAAVVGAQSPPSPGVSGLFE
jgi:hypothetical protein